MTGFIQSIITILAFILILGGLVIIHEVGHFVTARLAKVKVLEFGIGFPPRAKVLRSGGETLYTLNWLPIGGFVKLEGEDGNDADDPRSFAAQRYLTKMLILVAGVAMNIALAFVIFTGIAWLASPSVGVRFFEVQPGSPAAMAGLTAGEAIIAVDGDHYQFITGPNALTGLRDRALITTLWRGQLRISEALALKVSDFDAVKGTLRVLRGKGDKARVAIIDGQACDVLTAWIERRRKLGLTGHRPLFCTLQGKAIKTAHVRAMLPRRARKAGIEKRVHETIARGEPVRADDNPETLKRRLNAYYAQTAPLTAYYAQKGRLSSLDGMASIEQVAQAIDQVLEAKDVTKAPRAAPRPG